MQPLLARLKLNSSLSILKSPARGFFFVCLLVACNKQPSEIPRPSKSSFTYSSPLTLIDAIRTIAGYEDSHHVPGHENLGHDHSTVESWTHEEAVRILVREGEKYREENPTFEAILGHCFIPDHRYHALDGDLLKHYLNSVVLRAPLLQAAKALEKNRNLSWGLIFKDRIVLWGSDKDVVVVPRD